MRRSRPGRGTSSVDRPFLPTATHRTFLPSAASALSRLNARRTTWPLNAPASPRSPVSGTIRTVSTVSRCCKSGRLRTDDAARPTPAMRSLIVSAYGRIASILDLGAPELRGGDELERARDLARARDGLDPPLVVLCGRHAPRLRTVRRGEAALSPTVLAARASASNQPAIPFSSIDIEALDEPRKASSSLRQSPRRDPCVSRIAS